MNNTEKTVQYYDKNAVRFVQDTIDADFSYLQDEFACQIKKGGRILDLGCGSGRDSYAFILKGFDIVAMDGSLEMCKMASELIGRDVECATFQEYEPEGMFDGIWACASLMHMDKQDLIMVIKKIISHLKPGGLFYLSFKYGTGSSFIRNRFYTKLDEESAAELFRKIEGVDIRNQFITNDVRPERSTERWLNVFLIKKEDGTVLENQTNYVCRLQSKNDNREVFIYKYEDAEDLFVDQAFLLKRGTPNIDFQRLLTEVNQYFYTEDDMSNIEMESRYILEIPIEYETQVEAEGTIFNKEDSAQDNFNRKQVEKAGNYKYSKKPLVKGQTLFNSKMILDIAKGCYNFATKQQIRQLSKEIEKTYDAVRSIEKGQMDDRVACLKSGREQVLVALALKDEDEQRRAISIARSDMMTAKHQIGLHLKRKCEEFKPVSGNTLIRFFSGIMESGYLRNKDSEVYDLQQYYKFFLEATELLAASYLITDEEEAAKLVFQGSIDFLKDIDFSNVKSIAYTKKREDQFWFYDKAIAHFKTEQKHFLENKRRYESIAVEVMGEELLEVVGPLETESGFN